MHFEGMFRSLVQKSLELWLKSFRASGGFSLCMHTLRGNVTCLLLTYQIFHLPSQFVFRADWQTDEILATQPGYQSDSVDTGHQQSCWTCFWVFSWSVCSDSWSVHWFYRGPSHPQRYPLQNKPTWSLKPVQTANKAASCSKSVTLRHSSASTGCLRGRHAKLLLMLAQLVSLITSRRWWLKRFIWWKDTTVVKITRIYKVTVFGSPDLFHLLLS